MQVERTSGGLEVLVESVAETVRLGQALAKAVKPGVVIGLIGPLGAGKTQLSRSIAEALGAEPSEINSPTFTLINEYSAVIPIYHIDAYRLESGEEFEALGVDEYFEAGGLCLVEWANLVIGQLPRDSWLIELHALEPTQRRVKIQFPGQQIELAETLLENLGLV